MSNPLLLAFRAVATIMAAVFIVNWLFSPSSLTIEGSRDWDVDGHSLSQRGGRTFLFLSGTSGHRVKFNCEHYATLCAHVRARGTAGLHVWTAEIGYFASPSLIQARIGDIDIISLWDQQADYEARSLRRNTPLVIFLSLAVVAWRWPRLQQLLKSRNAAQRLR